MRIALIAHHGSVHTRRWADFFARRGHEMHVVTCGGGPAPGEAATLGYTVHDLGRPRPGKLGYLLKVAGARRRIRALAPDVVHAHYATSYGALAALSGRRPLVVTAHGDDVLIAPSSRLMRPLVRRVLGAADLITVPSDQMRAAALRCLGQTETPVLVFQYGVEAQRLGELAAAARAEPADGEALRVVSARPLLPLYRVDLLVRALARLRDDGVAATCDVAGEGPERARLERLAAQLGLAAQVRFHGRLAPAEVYDLLARADVCVSVAASDGASLAVLEALALGAIPVLSDIEANREWIRRGAAGVLAAPEPGAVAAAIREAAALAGEPARRRNLEVVREHADLAVNLGSFEAALQRLCASPVAAAPVEALA